MNKLERLKLPRNYRRLASLFEKNRLLPSLFCCSSKNSQSFFSFFIFNYVVLFSFCTQIFLFTRYEVAENDNFRQWLQNNRPFYRYGGHIELIGFNDYYGMIRGHEHDLIYSHQYLRALFGQIFLSREIYVEVLFLPEKLA